MQARKLRVFAFGMEVFANEHRHSGPIAQSKFLLTIGRYLRLIITRLRVFAAYIGSFSSCKIMSGHFSPQVEQGARASDAQVPAEPAAIP